jgi:hypothetical protein
MKKPLTITALMAVLTFCADWLLFLFLGADHGLRDLLIIVISVSVFVTASGITWFILRTRPIRPHKTEWRWWIWAIVTAIFIGGLTLEVGYLPRQLGKDILRTSESWIYASAIFLGTLAWLLSELNGSKPKKKRL